MVLYGNEATKTLKGDGKMSLKIATNIASESVQKNLRQVSEKIDSSLAKLSSGKRITSASDDASGLAIATNLEAQVRGLRQATRNANRGVALVQSMEGSLNETSNLLIRMRELSVQAAGDGITGNERKLLNEEYKYITEELDRISEQKTFNGLKMLQGEGAELDFQVGISANREDRIEFDGSMTDVSSRGIGVSGTEIADKDDARDAIDSVDNAINSVSEQRANLGSVQARLHSAVSNLETQTVHQNNARSIIQDVDVAEESSNLVSKQIIRQAGVEVLSQTNKLPVHTLKLLG